MLGQRCRGTRVLTSFGRSRDGWVQWGGSPDAECSGGFKPFFWADDANTDDHSLRADSIPSGKFIP